MPAQATAKAASQLLDQSASAEKAATDFQMKADAAAAAQVQREAGRSLRNPNLREGALPTSGLSRRSGPQNASGNFVWDCMWKS